MRCGTTNLDGDLAESVDEERHGQVGDAVAPSRLKRDIRLDRVVAGVQGGREAVVEAVVNEVVEQSLGLLLVARLGCVVNGVLVHTILLAKLDDGLLTAVVALVEVGSNAAEIKELVLLQRLGQGNVVKVVAVVNGALQALKVTFADEQRVEGLVDDLVVGRLNELEVGLDQWESGSLLNELDSASVVEA
jgi:hypothetical protein